MKKQFSHRRNSGGWGTAAWPLTAAGVLVVFILILRFTLPSVFVALASPLWKGGSSLDAGVASVFAGFGSNQKLSAENTALAAQVASLTNENQVLTARAQDLTKLLGGNTQGSVGSTEILAGVLARPPISAYDTLVVAAGSADGVAVGAEVYGVGTIPIGSVQSVTKHTATITLLSTGGKTTNAWVGENRTPITLTGTGAGTFTATISRAAAPSDGDTIYVSGPGAVPVGTVTNVTGDPSSPSVTLQILPLTNIFSVTWVEIART